MSTLSGKAYTPGISGRLGRYGWANALLAALIVGVGVVAYLNVGTSQTAAPVTRTATVQRGVVLSTVSASGNLSPSRELAVGFETTGTLTDVYVKAGQKVTTGELLARIDPSTAQMSVNQAEASLASANAQLEQTLTGETSAERAQDALAVTQAETQVENAVASVAAQRTSNALDAKTLRAAVTAQKGSNALDAKTLRAAVTAQKGSNVLDAKSLNAAVKQAKQQLRTDQGNLRGTVAKLHTDQAQLATDQQTLDTATAAVDTAQAKVTSDQASQQRIALGLLNAQQGQAADKANNASASTLADDQSSVNSWQREQQQGSYQLNQDQAALSSNQTALNTAQSAVNTDESNVNTDQSTVVSLEKAIVADRNAIASAERGLVSGLAKDKQALETAQQQLVSGLAKDKQALETAQQQLVSGLAKDKQALAAAQQQLTSARQNVASTKAGNAVKQAPAQPGTVAQQRAAVVQAQANLDAARKTLDETALRAPIAGTVSAVSGIVGQEVSGSGSAAVSSSSSSSSSAGGSGSGSSSGSSGVVTLTDLSGMEVVAPFSETDAANLRVGEPATVTIAALSSKQIPAHIVAIDTTSTVSSGVVTYDVTFALDRSDPSLKPGMTADVDVVTAEADNVLHVPTAAVQGSGSNASVTVLRNGVQTRVPVVAGLSGDSSTEIKSGLSAGQAVVLQSVSVSSSTGGVGTNGTNSGGGRFRGFGGFGGLGG